MRSLIFVALFAAAVAYTGTCDYTNCAPGCSCSCTATCTYSPTPSPTVPTAYPTSAPTGSPGRCCGTNGETGENFCVITDQEECEGATTPAPTLAPRRAAPANFVDTLNFNRRSESNLGGEWTANQFCNVANPCGNGVPVTSGGANFTVDVGNAGLGATGGISLTPTTEEDLPAGSAAKLPGDVILAFEVTRYDGSAAQPSAFLTPPNYVAVKIQPTDPEIEDANSVQVLRWDVDAGEWVDIQDECQGRIQSTAFTLDTNTDPNTLTVYLCHTSHFVMTANTDSADKKTKKGKKDKVPTVGKGAPKEGKKEGAKDAKGGKKVGIAVGAAVGGAAVLAGAAIAVVKCRNGKKAKKTNKKAGKARETAEVAAPVGMSV